MGRQIHFEIFARRGSAGGWRLSDVRHDRDEAVAAAKAMLAEGTTGVKVVKETYDDETGDYLMLKIFEDGYNKMKSAPAQEDAQQISPCFKPEDLYSYHARQVIARLIPDFLARNKVTVTELGHRADLLEKLEATGTVLQHAIQKVAVAQASAHNKPVQQLVKHLNELTGKAFSRVFRDHRNNVFPDIEPGGFGPLAAKLAGEADGLYLFNGAVARYLADAAGWDEKVFRLIALMDEATDETGGPFLLAAVDSLIAETLEGSAALHELIGTQDNLGAALMNLVQLFLGVSPPDSSERQGLVSLTKRFAADQLPDARTAIANRLVTEFKSSKRLCPKSLGDEFRTLRQIANRVVLGVGKYLGHEDLVEAFTLRSARLINQVTLTEYLADVSTPHEKLERLLFVEENIIGAENKRQLATFVLSMLATKSLESHFLSAQTPAIPRLQRLAELNARVRRSGFQDNQRTEIADALDRVASQVEAQSKVLDSINAKQVSHVEKAVMVLRLFTQNSFTEPRLADRARAMMAGYLATPGFLSGYVQRGRVEPEAAVADLKQTLEKIGLTPETGLKAIAA